MTRKKQIKILDDKIKTSESQYNLDRINAEISTYSSGDLPKYEYLAKKDFIEQRNYRACKTFKRARS